jgi:hypothetical protein
VWTCIKRDKTGTALAVIESQRKARTALSGERTEAASTLVALNLKAERARRRLKDRRPRPKRADPVCRRASRRRDDTDSGRAIRRLIALIVLSARDRISGCGVGAAINNRLKPHLVRSTFESCRADLIEGSQQLRANSGLSSKPCEQEECSDFPLGDRQSTWGIFRLMHR